MGHCKAMSLQVGIEEGSRSMAVCVSGLQYCQYSQKKINLITLMSDLVFKKYTSNISLYKRRRQHIMPIKQMRNLLQIVKLVKKPKHKI
jgi:hypothetical protein